MATVISALIAGVFSIIGVLLNYKLTNGSGSTGIAPKVQVLASNSPAPLMGAVISTPRSVQGVNFGKVLIQIGIIQLVANVVGFIIGLAFGSSGASIDTILATILVVGTIILIVSYYLSGISVDRTIVWKHLTYVAIGVALVSLLLALIVEQQFSGVGVFVAFLQSFFAMAIGGSIARMRKPKVVATPLTASSYPQYQQQPSLSPHPVYEPTVAVNQRPVVRSLSPDVSAQGTTWGYLAFSNGKRVELTGKRIVVGRAKYGSSVINPEIDLSSQPEANSVSHMHAALENYGNAFTVTDLQSMNGTVVSGRRLEPHRAVSVNDGDTLYFGRIKCVFIKA